MKGAIWGGLEEKTMTKNLDTCFEVVSKLIVLLQGATEVRVAMF